MIDTDEIVKQVSESNHKTVELLNLLARSNTLLIEYVLTKEVEISTGGSPARTHVTVREQLALPPANGNGHHHPEIAEPVAVPPRRGRPPKPYTVNNGHKTSNYVVSPGTKASWLTDFAQQNGGLIDFAKFREDFKRRRRKPDSFIKTTMHGACRILTRDGIMERIDSTHYRLIDPSRVPPLNVATQTVPPPPPPPPPVKTKNKQPPHNKGKARHVRGGVQLLHEQEIIDFAKQHNWRFVVADVRKAWKNKPGIPPTYTKTTIFTDLNTLAARGLMKKAGPGVYEVVPQ